MGSANAVKVAKGGPQAQLVRGVRPRPTASSASYVAPSCHVPPFPGKPARLVFSPTYINTPWFTGSVPHTASKQETALAVEYRRSVCE